MSITPLLRCKNLKATQDFYASLPGFSVIAADASLLTLELSGNRLLFTEQDLWQSPPMCSGTFYFTVTDVDQLFSQLNANITISWPLQDMPYGSREFGITDCNGYILAFQQTRN
ncbi:MAG: hypothetical protein REI12_08850 [Pedobacter sp.]|nr:hypothetical protein [Pedobacter sp.]